MLKKYISKLEKINYEDLINQNIDSYLKKRGLENNDLKIEAAKHHNISLNRDKYVEQLSTSICNYFDKPWSFENNTILLDGTWGTGKTWILRQAEGIFEKKLKDDINWLNFSAHLYLSEKELFFDLYDTLHDPNYLKKLITNNDNGFTESQKKDALLKSLKWTHKAINLFGQNRQTFVRLILPISSALLAASGLGWLPIVSKIAYDVLAPFMANNLKEWGINDENIELFKVVFSKVNELAGDNLKDQVEKTGEENNKKQISNLFTTKKTVIIIDDLDRCHESKLWKIFSMLSLFDSQDNILFVLAGSSNYMIKILDKKYHVLGEGENFLAKFVGRWIYLETKPLEEIL